MLADEMIEIDENKRCSEIVDGKSVSISSECEVEKELHERHVLASNTTPEESASRHTFISDKSESADHRERKNLIQQYLPKSHFITCLCMFTKLHA